jgi:ParB family chromosome partitioning protein
MSAPAKKRGLGRGLDALIQTASAAAAAAAPEETALVGTHTLPIARLTPNRFQPRTSFGEQAIEELAASIRTQGVMQPLVVTPAGDGSFVIVAGERRFRAAQLAGLTEVPVVVRQVADDRELLELALVENLQRADLNPVEEAEAYRTLHETFGLSQEAVAERVGKSRPTVANALRLLRLPAEVIAALREGRLTAGQARPLLSLASAAEQERLAARAMAEGLSARAIEAAVAPATPPVGKRGKAPAPPAEVHAAAAAERLTRRLQTKVEIHRRGPGGDVRIQFHSEDELMRLFEALMGQGD